MHLEKLTGKSVDGIPLAVPIGVVARDSEQQAASLQITAFVIVPTQSLAAAIAAHEAQIADAQQRAIQLRPPMARAMAAEGQAASGQSIEAMRKQIAELERKNQDLEAQNKLLRELLNTSQKNGK